MNEIERMKMVSAMEFIARHINNEEVFEPWLSLGVADGDINDGDMCAENAKDYTEDKDFANIMDLFLELVSDAYKDGGLYCDGIVSKEWEG